MTSFPPKQRSASATRHHWPATSPRIGPHDFLEMLSVVSMVSIKVACCFVSGVTACFGILAAYLCGTRDVALYDGSWTDYFFNGKPENMVFASSDQKSNI